MRAIFLDKDGTLIKDVPYNVNPELIELSFGAARGLRLLAQRGYALFVVSNQAGIAKGLFPEAAMRTVERRLTALLQQEGVVLAGFHYCPHFAGGNVTRYAIACDCRKPQPGMLLQAAAMHEIELPESWMIGDILDDVEAGHRAGCRSVFINNGNETEWKMSDLRRPDLTALDLYRAAEAILEMDQFRSRLKFAHKAVQP
jgi:D-glycero-D-manno-heptose 1,7-bisphosphate phosphatase